MKLFSELLHNIKKTHFKLLSFFLQQFYSVPAGNTQMLSITKPYKAETKYEIIQRTVTQYKKLTLNY